MYFDSHAHYDDKRFIKDRDSLLSRFKAEGVDYVLNSGATYESSVKAIELAQAYDFIYAAVGVHPHDADTMDEQMMEELIHLCKHEKVVAYGEIGLDFFYDHSPREIQQKWFQRQLAEAKKIGLPVIIHCREADQLVFNMIKEADLPVETKRGQGAGVIHCFSGSVEMAQEYVKLGYYIGVGGVVTFPNGKKLMAVVEKLPLEKILIETDCPYLAPHPHRGERNDSLKLPFVVEKISQIKGVCPLAVAEQTKTNAMKLFGVK